MQILSCSILRKPLSSGSLLFLTAAFVLAGCLTDVPPSPGAGVLRVTLQADAADTTLQMLGRTTSIRPGDAFVLSVSNGAAYRDTSFALLMANIDDYRPSTRMVNIVARENGEPPVYKVFETLVPPAQYDSLVLAVEASTVYISRLEIPVNLPPDEKELMYFPTTFDINEGDTTVVELVIRPLSSVVRYRDQFLFQRQIQVARVTYR